jgi:lipopolysaccharide export system protein LptA
MNKRRVRPVVLAMALCLLALACGVSLAKDYQAVPKVQVRADNITEPANESSPVVLTGAVKVTFPTFELTAERVEVSWQNPPSADRRTLLLHAEKDVVLHQGSQELKFRSLTFEIDKPQ